MKIADLGPNDADGTGNSKWGDRTDVSFYVTNLL